MSKTTVLGYSKMTLQQNMSCANEKPLQKSFGRLYSTINIRPDVKNARSNTSNESERMSSNSQTSLHTRCACRRDTRTPLKMQQPHTRNRLQRPSISIILKRQTMSHLTTPRYPPQILHRRKKRAISLLPTIFP